VAYGTEKGGSASGTADVSVDTVAGTDYQRVKLVDGAEGGTGGVPGSATDGLLVNLGANNDVTVSGVSIAAVDPYSAESNGTLTVDIDDAVTVDVNGAAAVVFAINESTTGQIAFELYDGLEWLAALGYKDTAAGASDVLAFLDSENIDFDQNAWQLLSSGYRQARVRVIDTLGSAVAVEITATATARQPTTVNGSVSIGGALPSGNNNIGNVDVLTIAAGDNNIGNVDVVTLPELSPGDNNIGNVDVVTLPDVVVASGVLTAVTAITQALPSGNNNIGDVDIVTMPNVTIGGGAVIATQGIAADLKAEVSNAGTFAVQADTELTTADLDTGAGTDTRAVVGLVGSKSGGGEIIPGDTTNGLDVDVTRLPALVAGSANIGDVDVLTVPAPLSTAGHGTAAAALRVELPTDGTGVIATVGTITNAVTVSSHAVTNAGTFATQVDGAALTALQLIDDPVAVLGTATYTEAATKGNIVGAVRRDADTTLVDTTNEIAPLIVDARGLLKVEAFSGESLPVTYATTGSGNATGALRVELPTNGTGVIATVGAVTAITNALPTGSNAIGKLAANDGVDIGNVDVASVTGTVTTLEKRAATAALTIVADNAASTSILAANANRLKAIITNDSSARLHLRFEAAAASTSNYGVSLAQHETWEELIYTGEIRGIWASDPNDGSARITEFTA
jgi:hypothetical protein